MPIKLFLTLLLIATTVQAKDLYQANLSLRSMAMGGTINSWVRDTDAVLFNPAALGVIEKLDIKIAGVSAGVGVNGSGSPLDIYNEWKDLGSISGPSDFAKLSGKDLYVGGNGKLGFAVPNFGAVMYTDNYMMARFHSPPNPTFDAAFNSDYALAGGFAFTLAKDTQAGITMKRINRWGGEKQIDMGVLLDSNFQQAIRDSFDSRGVAYGIDLGLLHTLSNVPLKPTLAVTWQDVGSTAFTLTSGTTAPQRIQDNVSLGASATAELVIIDITTAVEYKFVNQTGEQLGKKLHAGVEASLPIIDLRMGVNQGYMTYGVGIDAFFLTLDLAYMPTEIGAYPGQTLNNRFQFGLTLDLSFDANFKLHDSNGRKRKLKQRR